MRPALGALAFVLAALSLPTAGSSQDACQIAVPHGGPDGGGDVEALVRRAAQRCRPGQTIEVSASRGMPLHPGRAAALLCDGGAFSAMRVLGTPWVGVCQYRGANGVP